MGANGFVRVAPKILLRDVMTSLVSADMPTGFSHSSHGTQLPGCILEFYTVPSGITYAKGHLEVAFCVFGSKLILNMRIKELFNPAGVSQSFAGLTVFLDQNNCQIRNKTKQEDAVLLHLLRESDGVEGHAYLRVKKEYSDFQDQLLRWVFNEPGIVGLTINGLTDFETGFELTSVGGQQQLSQQGS